MPDGAQVPPEVPPLIETLAERFAGDPRW